MANAASISISATMLPDEIATTLSGSMTVTPDDANDKWYYKKTIVTTTSADLIAGSFLDYTAVDQDTAPTAVATGDKVKFCLFRISPLRTVSCFRLMRVQRLITLRTVSLLVRHRHGFADCRM